MTSVSTMPHRPWTYVRAGGAVQRPSCATGTSSARGLLPSRRGRQRLRVQHAPGLSQGSFTVGATTQQLPRRLQASRRSRPRLTARASSTNAPRSSASQESFHSLPDGVSLQVLSQRGTPPAGGSGGDAKTPLVFLHGVGHAAWCWEETFFPFFSERGHDCHAISFRGQGGSGAAPGADFAGTTAQHAADVSHFLTTSALVGESRFVLVGHSYGGLVAQHALLLPPQPHSPGGATAAAMLNPLRSRAAGLALLASLPPAGYGPVAARIAAGGGRRDTAEPRIVVGVPTDPPVCRRKYFATDMDTDTVRRYMERLLVSSRVRLVDLSAAEAPLPPPPRAEAFPPVLVLCGDEDFIIDAEAVRETAAAYGTEPVELPRVAHDLMLDVRWESAAHALERWLAALPPK